MMYSLLGTWRKQMIPQLFQFRRKRVLNHRAR